MIPAIKDEERAFYYFLLLPLPAPEPVEAAVPLAFLTDV